MQRMHLIRPTNHYYLDEPGLKLEMPVFACACASSCSRVCAASAVGACPSAALGGWAGSAALLALPNTAFSAASHSFFFFISACESVVALKLSRISFRCSTETLSNALFTLDPGCIGTPFCFAT